MLSLSESDDEFMTTPYIRAYLRFQVTPKENDTW